MSISKFQSFSEKKFSRFGQETQSFLDMRFSRFWTGDSVVFGLYQILIRLDRSIEKVDKKRFKLNLQQRHSDYLIDSNSSGTHLAQIWLISRFFMEHFQAQWENSGFDGKGV